MTAHLGALEQARLSTQVVLPLSGLVGAAARAQDLARLHPYLERNLRGADGNNLRAEVFSVFALRHSDLSAQSPSCRPEPCMRVEIYDVRFNGIPVLTSAKLVEWHVSYSEREGFGYSDAVGCPNFAVLVSRLPRSMPKAPSCGLLAWDRAGSRNRACAVANRVFFMLVSVGLVRGR